MPEAISVIIPALNERPRIESAVLRLRESDVAEVIVVDGGSRDGTPEIARELGATVLQCEANRGRQQNLGARQAGGSILLFLHVDTVLPQDFASQIRETLAAPAVSAGAFRFGLDCDGWQLRLVERVVAFRCRLFRLPYGDQALFVTAENFRTAGGFADIPVMEDFDFVMRMRALGRIQLASGIAVTSARRWVRDGVARVTWRHQLCILGYYAGVAPGRLARLRNGHGSREARAEDGGIVQPNLRSATVRDNRDLRR